MLSVVIATHDHERALLPTLAALVPGVIAGMVHEVIVAVASLSDATAQIADAAGCRVLTARGGRGARLNEAAAGARARWLLFFCPGFVPDADWINQTRRFVEEAELRGSGGTQAALFAMRATRFRPALSDAWALLRAALTRELDARQGMLIAKSHYEALGGHRDVDEPERDLIRRLGRRHVVFLCTGTVTK
jgi:glycosyltransferase involved in cell wall biosynthesis